MQEYLPNRSMLNPCQSASQDAAVCLLVMLLLWSATFAMLFSVSARKNVLLLKPTIQESIIHKSLTFAKVF